MAQNRTTKNITYSAICVALSVVSIILSRYTPAQVVPLALSSLCVYIAFKKCGVIYGALSVIATVAIAFFLCGISITFVFLCALFMPYSIIAFLMQKLSYKVMWQAGIRILVSSVLFCVVFFLIIYLSDFLVGTKIGDLVLKIGKLPTSLIITLTMLPVDLFFNYASERVLKTIK